MNIDGIIKNRLRMKAIITNARAYYKLCEEFGAFNVYLWDKVNYVPIINAWIIYAITKAKMEHYINYIIKISFYNNTFLCSKINQHHFLLALKNDAII